MNQVLLATSQDVVTVVFDRLERRQQVTAGGAGGGLKSGALDAFEAAVAEKVQELKELAARSVREGWEAVQGAVRSFTGGVEEAATQLGKRAQEFRDRLMDVIRSVIAETFDFMLSAMRAELKVGGQTYRMASIDMEQKLVFTGSIDISVTSLCKLLGSGELVVKGKYTINGAAPVASA